MRLLTRSLKNRFTGEIDLALYEELGADIKTITGYVVITTGPDGKTRHYKTEAEAVTAFNRLASAAKNRAPSRYSDPRPRR